jgi:hypothetical protein
MTSVITLHDYESLGSEMILNGKFESDLRNWTGTGWVWSPQGGGADHIVGSIAPLTQSSVVVVVEDFYQLKFSIAGLKHGSVIVSVGGASLSVIKSCNTSLAFTASTTTALTFTPTSDFDGIIDNVSLVRMIGGVFLVNDMVVFNSAISFKLPDGTLSSELFPISTEGAFTNTNLTAGILTFNHYLGKKYVSVTVFDETDNKIIPDFITPININTVNIDISSWGTITGTWHIRASK